MLQWLLQMAFQENLFALEFLFLLEKEYIVLQWLLLMAFRLPLKNLLGLVLWGLDKVRRMPLES